MIARTARQFPLVIALVVLLALAPIALAGKGSGGGGSSSKPSGGGSATGSFSRVMVYDANGDGLPNWNDQITFNVSSSATDPTVTLTCMQGTTQVDNQTVGFYPSWPWSQTFTLSHWYYWPTDSAASCTARLYYTGSKGSTVTLATLKFDVNA